MAAWQVDFYIIPRRALLSRGALDTSDLDTTPWWATHTLPPDYQRRLGAVASAGPSSSADVQTWGSEDGNRIDVWSEDSRVSAIMARVDVRRLDSKFGAALLQFVRTADAVLVRSDGLRCRTDNRRLRRRASEFGRMEVCQRSSGAAQKILRHGRRRPLVRFADVFTTALTQIRANKLRSFFTLLGIIVSVAFLVAVVAVIQGMNAYVKENIADALIGSNTFQVRRSADQPRPDRGRRLAAHAAASEDHDAGCRRRARGAARSQRDLGHVGLSDAPQRRPLAREDARRRARVRRDAGLPTRARLSIRVRRSAE